MAILDSVVVFLVSLLVGGLGIYLGALVITDTDDYSRAVWTALIGAIIWGVVGFLFGWIPLLGPAIVLLAYVAVIKARYPGGWVTAALIALSAWAATVLILYGLAVVGVGGFDAIGIPGV
jgi:hypothetical protein